LPNVSALTDFDRNGTRQRIRNQRNAITESERHRAEIQVATNLLRMATFQRARHVSVYFATDGELSLENFLARAKQRNKQLYAPVIQGNDIRFAMLQPDTTMTLNRFGIPEPTTGPFIDARSLDLILTPLVAFDDCGNRLGMGGGYYDRCFHFLRTRENWIRPKLVGIGFDLQHVRSIRAEPWDIRLWCAVTKEKHLHFR
jgi:5-formyltetrahydrofolate cyclo-ligase